jgi:hypothetical protein
MNKIAELEEQIKRHSEVSQILTKQLEELKLSAKEEEFKVGDYVFILDKHDSKYNNGEVVKVARMSDLHKVYNSQFYWLYTDTGGNDIVLSKNTRKATKEEIESHLIKEAEKKGFVKGAKVKGTAYLGGKFSATIDKVTISFGTEYLFQLWRNNTSEFWGIKNLSDAELIPSHPSITINGYKAEFKEWGLDFNNGCAKIDKDFFIQISKYFNHGIEQGTGNKPLTAVIFGSGEFTIKQINEIANYYKSK